jgi:endonuclease YncB( thermonuclease family)
MIQRARRAGRFIASVGLLAVAGGVIYVTRGVPQREITGAAEAIDGDSLKLAGEEIRLKGIDAPELNQICQVSGRETPCGREARTQLRRLLGSGLTTCVGEERDRYGRLLSVCRVRGIEINAAMVREGHAVAFGAYAIEETEARGAYRGLWAGTFERPRDWRAAHPSTPR